MAPARSPAREDGVMARVRSISSVMDMMPAMLEAARSQIIQRLDSPEAIPPADLPSVPLKTSQVS